MRNIRFVSKKGGLGWMLILAVLFGSAELQIALAEEIGQQKSAVSGDLVIFHAGSLSVPFKQIASAFNREYPEVKVLAEAAGSRACARKISDLGRPCDVMASADYGVIDTLLIPEYADWNIKFAANQMAIVYSEKSRGRREVNATNWFEILLKPDIAFGRADPNSDPCGYRAILTIKLAADYYGKAELAENLLKKDVRYIRPKETDLLALLEAGEIDYIFLYRSVAVQHGLKFVILPDEINLGTPRFDDRYRTACTEITGSKPGAVVSQCGESITYGVTIPKHAPNPAAAMAFVAFLLDKDRGMAIMEKNGQQSLVPSPTETHDVIPGALKKFAEKTGQD